MGWVRLVSRCTVSIHARHCWRTNTYRAVACWLQFVSIHARHCWRTNRAGGGGTSSRSCFNPRPPLLADKHRVLMRKSYCHECFNPRPPLLADELIEAAAMKAFKQFQSTPAIAGGRTMMAGTTLDVTLFQSTPAIAGGRTKIIHLAGFGGLVSIHARHCWRTNKGKCTSHGRSAGFNPRPPLLADEPEQARAMGRSGTFQSTPAIAGGRTFDVAIMDGTTWVSIHARHCWRTNDALLNTSAAVEVSIHARHCWRTNKAMAQDKRETKAFQSTPAIAGGRTGRPAALA